MANPEHVDILMQGVEAWNKWREENPEIKPDLSDLELDVKTTSRTPLFNRRWGRISLKGANLDDANLECINLRGVDLQEASLVACDLSGSDLQGARLYKANLKRSNLQEANLTELSAPLADFTEANIVSANFGRAILGRSCFKGAEAMLANFSAANLPNTEFNGALLKGAHFKDALLRNADFRKADIRQSLFGDAQVSGVHFDRKTKCRGIDVSSCYGSQMFRTFAQDKDFLEEFKEKRKFWYWVWLLSADCGRSFWPWALWSLGFAVLFAALYYGVLGPESFHINGDLPPTFMTMTYYSVVTFTTLGFGDLTPATTTAAVFVMFEVVLGYIMLGGLISILANKLARRA